jgi:hypothetical protein
LSFIYDTNEKSQEEFKIYEYSNGVSNEKVINLVIENANVQIEENITYPIETNKYDYGYTVSLTFPNEDGLMDSYLNGKLILLLDEKNDDRPREDPSDWFNFGFNEETWMNYLNKSILMHYEKNILNQQLNPESKATIPPMGMGYPIQQMQMMGTRVPNQPMNMNYPSMMTYQMMRFMHPGMMYPPTNFPTNQGMTDEIKKP